MSFPRRACSLAEPHFKPPHFKGTSPRLQKAPLNTHHGSEALRFPHHGDRAQQGCEDQGHANADPKVENWKEGRHGSCGQTQRLQG